MTPTYYHLDDGSLCDLPEGVVCNRNHTTHELAPAPAVAAPAPAPNGYERCHGCKWGCKWGACDGDPEAQRGAATAPVPGTTPTPDPAWDRAWIRAAAEVAYYRAVGSWDALADKCRMRVGDEWWAKIERHEQENARRDAPDLAAALRVEARASGPLDGKLFGAFPDMPEPEPAGVRVEARIQSVTASGSLHVAVHNSAAAFVRAFAVFIGREVEILGFKDRVEVRPIPATATEPNAR